MNVRALERSFDVVAFAMRPELHPRKYGPEIAVTCPRCGKAEKLWVLTVDKGDKKPGLWNCFYCGVGGPTALSYIQWVEQCSKVEAIKLLTKGGYLKDQERDHNFREMVLSTLQGVAAIEEEWDGHLTDMSLPDGFKLVAPPLPAYFKTRGIDFARVQKYGLGYCTGGYYDNRLIVPVFAGGLMPFFVARWMSKDPGTVRCPTCKGVKFKPCPMCQGKRVVKRKKTLYPACRCKYEKGKLVKPCGAHPNRVLYNYDTAKTARTIVIVEDVFSAMQVGDNAVATFGTTLSQYQLDWLLRTNAEEIVIMWDRDATVRYGTPRHTEAICEARAEAGKPCPDCHRYEKTIDLAERLREFWSVKLVQLPDERDPDEHTSSDLARFTAEADAYGAGDAFRDVVLARLG